MNLNWVFGLLVCAVGNVLPLPPIDEDENVYKCPEPGCTKTFLTANGRLKHFKRKHQGIQNQRKLCQHGCGKSYSIKSHNALKFHERTCERNPSR